MTVSIGIDEREGGTSAPEGGHPEPAGPVIEVEGGPFVASSIWLRATSSSSFPRAAALKLQTSTPYGIPTREIGRA